MNRSPIINRFLIAALSLNGACGDSPVEAELIPSGQGPAAPQLALGGVHSCLLGTTGHVLCWGRYGANPAMPTIVSAPTLVTPPDGSIKFTAITAGTTTCGITAEKHAYCWGSNLHGELGDGTKTAHADPRPVMTNLRFNEIESGTFSTCGVAVSGTAYCWGAADLGVLGAGLVPEGTTQLTPAPVAGNLKFLSLSGSFIFCGIADNSSTYCWGITPGTADLAAYRVSGDCATTYYIVFTGKGCVVPTLVAGTRTFTSLGTGNNGFTMCGLDANQNVHCWGEGSFGTLGNNRAGPGVYSVAPTPVSTSQKFKQIASAAMHVCALDLDGAAFCWGSNYRGYLGTGTQISGSSIPLAVAGGHRFVSLAAGGTHTCALKSNAEVWCWGSGTEGQLGQPGQFVDSSVPVRVDLSSAPAI